MASANNFQMLLREIVDFLKIGNSMKSLFIEAPDISLFDEVGLQCLYDLLHHYMDLAFRGMKQEPITSNAVLLACYELIKLAARPQILCNLTSADEDNILRWKQEIKKLLPSFFLSTRGPLESKILELVEDIQFEDEVQGKTLKRVERLLRDARKVVFIYDMKLEEEKDFHRMTSVHNSAGHLMEQLLSFKSFGTIGENICQFKPQKACLEEAIAWLENERKLTKQARIEAYDKMEEADLNVLMMRNDLIMLIDRLRAINQNRHQF